MVFALLGGDIDDEAADKALQETGLSADDAQVNRKSQPGSTAADIMGQMLTDRMFRVPTEALCEARAGAESRTYLYQSAWRSPAMGALLGAAHCVEIALGSEPPQGLADRMHRAWVGFVTDADPGWPAFSLDTRPVMVIDDESAVMNDPLRLPRSLWGTA